MARGRFIHGSERGAVFVEYLLTLPLLVILLTGLVDSAQMVLLHAQVDNLVREAGNLVSRGLTPDQAWATLQEEMSPLDLNAKGQVIITTIQRKTPGGNQSGDDTPTVQTQNVYGGQSYLTSRVGSPGQPATIPGITSLPDGIVMLAVEVAYTFDPAIPPPQLTKLQFPAFISDAAYF